VSNLLDKINKYFIELYKPKRFRPGHPDNAIIALELYYEELCSLLENNGTPGPKNLTLFEFYARLNYLKKTGPKMRM